MIPLTVYRDDIHDDPEGRSGWRAFYWTHPWNWSCRVCGVSGWAATHPQTIERAHEHLTTCKEWNQQ